jgi:hypothetical protein
MFETPGPLENIRLQHAYIVIANISDILLQHPDETLET